MMLLTSNYSKNSLNCTVHTDKHVLYPSVINSITIY